MRQPTRIEYKRPSLVVSLLAPLLSGESFAAFFDAKFKARWTSFYNARNGVYYILRYLKRTHRSGTVFLPDGICEVVRLASKLAGCRVVYYKTGMKGIKKGDVLLATDSSTIPPAGVYSIEDNAKHPNYPNSRFDFTLYSFGGSKPLSGCGGGVVVVNNRKFKNFLNIGGELHEAGIRANIGVWANYIRWKLIEYEPLHRNPTIISMFRSARQAVKGNYMPRYGVPNLSLRMPAISMKLVGRGLGYGSGDYAHDASRNSRLGC